MAHTTLGILLARLDALEARFDARLKVLESQVAGGTAVSDCYAELQASMRKLDSTLKKTTGRRGAQGSA